MLRVVKRCVIIWTFTSALVATLSTLFSEYEIWITLIGLVVAAIGFIGGEDFIIDRIMFYSKIYTKAEKDLCGSWNIEITYGELNNRKTKFGELEIKLYPFGLFIRGARIRDGYIDSSNDVEEWTSDHVQITEHTRGNKVIRTLEYAYKIRRENDLENEYSKIGNVILVYDFQNEIFKGSFGDIFIPKEGNNVDEVIKSGSVKLQRR